MDAAPITDWMVEFWRSAQQASPFGAMGAVICLGIVWRALRRAQADLLSVTVRSIESQVHVERTLDRVTEEFLAKSGRRKRGRA